MSSFPRIFPQHPKQLGRLVVFEGPDNTGKTTVSRLLAETLTRRGKKCIWLAFPGHEGGTLGAKVYALHHDAQFAHVPSISMQLMHVAAHIEALQRRILPELAAGTCVVLDRYWWSTWVYGMTHGADPKELQLALQIEKQQWKNVRPAVAFLFTRKDRGGTANQSVLRRYYRQIAAQEKTRYPVAIVSNNGTVEETLRKVSSIVEQVHPQGL